MRQQVEYRLNELDRGIREAEMFLERQLQNMPRMFRSQQDEVNAQIELSKIEIRIAQLELEKANLLAEEYRLQANHTGNQLDALDAQMYHHYREAAQIKIARKDLELRMRIDSLRMRF